MSCGVEARNDLVLWKFQSVLSKETEILFNGYNVPKVRSKHSINASTAGEFNLMNSYASLEDAGTYQCIKTIHNQRSYRKEIGIAELTVLCKSGS